MVSIHVLLEDKFVKKVFTRLTKKAGKCLRTILSTHQNFALDSDAIDYNIISSVKCVICRHHRNCLAVIMGMFERKGEIEKDHTKTDPLIQQGLELLALLDP